MPITFTKEEPQKDLFAGRKEVIKESLDIDKIICPISNIDPSIDYSSAGTMVKQFDEDSKNVQSLFTIRDDDDFDQDE